MNHKSERSADSSGFESVSRNNMDVIADVEIPEDTTEPVVQRHPEEPISQLGTIIKKIKMKSLDTENFLKMDIPWIPLL